MRPLVTATFLLALPAVAGSQAMPTPAAAGPVIDSLARAHLAAGAPSVAIALIRGNDTLAIGAWGKADVELDVPATPTSVYRIGSVTKQFTAAAVMQLVEQGKVSLDDPIGDHIADLPDPWQPVTVLQLLNHTSGIPSYTSLGEAWARRWGEEMTPDSILAMVRDKPMDFAPGSRFAYNNSGYILLGMLIEKLTGDAWGDDIATRFAAPLGLTDLRNCLNAPIIPRRVSGYTSGDSGIGNAAFLAMTQPYAAGALCATVGDLARWNRALHTGGVVSEDSYRQMTTPSGAATASRYGFGLMRDTLAGREIITHGGGIHGFASANAWEPESQLSVTVLTNTDSESPNELLKQLARLALGHPLLTRPPVVPLAATDRDRYTGTYLMQMPGQVVEFVVALSDSGLTGKFGPQQPIPMVHYGNHVFGADFDPTLRLTFTMQEGGAVAMTLSQRGMTFQGKREK